MEKFWDLGDIDRSPHSPAWGAVGTDVDMGAGSFRKQLPVLELKNLDLAARTAEFVISTEDVDRDGDIIRAAGWDLENYKTNPVVLWAHQHGTPPVARAPDIGIQGKQLRATAQFYEGPGPHGEFAAEVFDMYAMGFMRATSVGFKATKRPNLRRGDPDEDGFRPILGLEFVGQELLEFSMVPVPSNPAALATFAAKGLMGELFPKSWERIAPDLGYTAPDADPEEPTPNEADRAREIRADHLKRLGNAIDAARLTIHLQRLEERLKR